MLRQSREGSCILSIYKICSDISENMSTSLPSFCSFGVEMVWLQTEGDGERTLFYLIRIPPLLFPPCRTRIVLLGKMTELTPKINACF